MILPSNTSGYGTVVFEFASSWHFFFLLKAKTEIKVWEEEIIILLQDVCRSVLLKCLLNHRYLNGSNTKFQNHGPEITFLTKRGIITVLVKCRYV